MSLKFGVTVLTSASLFLYSCANKKAELNTSDFNNLKIQMLDSQPTPVSSTKPIKIDHEALEAPPSTPPDNSEIINVKHQELEKEKSAYNNSVLPEIEVKAYKQYGIIPGKVQIVFKNGLQVKIKKDDNKKLLIEEDSLATTEDFRKIIESHSVIDGYDLALGMSQSEVEAVEQRIKEHYQGYIPERSAIQNYIFPKDTDLISLVKRLRELPSIHSANLEKVIVPAYTKYQVSQISNNGSTVSTGSSPSDPGFHPSTGFPESNNWWWLNRHKFLLAWPQFNGTMPTIAIIDTGFDTESSAIDKPNYTGAMRIVFCSAVGVSNCGDVTSGNAAVQEPSGNNVNRDSHGTMVASIAGSPKDNGSNLAGAAPGAPIMPIRVMIPNGVAGCLSDLGCLSSENIATAIRYAASQSSVDVINLSLATLGDCPMSLSNNIIRAEIQSAISAGKIVVAAVGNNLKSLQDHIPHNPAIDSGCYSKNNPTGGEIIVGGVESDTSVSPPRTKGWDYGGSGSSYDRVEYYSGSQAAAYITVAAASRNIRVPIYNPNGTSVLRGTDIEQGTSLATPMVAAVAGMMKKVGQANSPTVTYTPAQIKSLLYGTADVSRYTTGTTNNTVENKFLGYLLPFVSTPRMIGVYSLNALNAIMVAKKLSSYQAMVRIHNIDDSLRATVNNDWSFYMYDGYGQDALWGLGGLSSGNTINFRLYNTGGGIARGYTVFRSKQTSFMSSVGVSGVAGADYNASKPVGWSDYVNYTY